MTDSRSQPMIASAEELLALAAEYEAGHRKMVASGYEEFGPYVQRRHQMVIDALRFQAAGVAQGQPSTMTDHELENIVLTAMHETMCSAAIEILTAKVSGIERVTISGIGFAKELLRQVARTPDPAQAGDDWKVKSGLTTFHQMSASVAQAARGLTHIPTDLAGAINALIDYADDLDATERPAIGEYDVSADIRIVCQVAIDALSPLSSATRKWDEPDYEGCGVDTKRAVDRFNAEAVMRRALESIAANGCCDRCQEAALVARKALSLPSTMREGT